MVREITYIILLIWIVLSACLSGCTGLLSRPEPRKNADELALKANFEKNWIKTSKFKFLTYQKGTALPHTIHTTKRTANIVRVYIEGDGKSYLDKMHVSPDPTPHNPLALKLALLDPRANVVYLARPCQYMPVSDENVVNDKAFDSVCRPEVWTSLRFSEPVIASINEALDNIKKQHQAKKIELIGFSGGAAVAVLLAARRNDIESLKTVAGDLNHESMSEYHGTTPLSRCLNPSDPDCIKKLARLSQHHFAGEEDKIVPAFISEDFVNACQAFNQHNKSMIKRTLVKNASHHEGWEEIWPKLFSTE